MHLASGRWLQIYRYTTIIIQALIVVGFVVFALIPTQSNLSQYVEFLQVVHPGAVLIALIHIFFGFIGYKNIAIKNEQVAGGVLGALLLLSSIPIIHASGGLLSPWLALVVINAALIGMLGPALSALPPLLITLYFIVFQIHGSTIEAQIFGQNIDFVGLGILLSVYIISYCSWLYWKRFYVDKESMELDKLSGQLKSRKHISEMLIQSITDGIIVTETTGKITVMNTAAANMTEWSIDESIGIDVRNVVKLQEESEKDLDASIDVFSEVIRNKSPMESKLALIGRSGKKLMTSVNLSPIIMPDTDEMAGAVAVIRDVSKAHGEEKRRADFISTASHEMRTPVAAIEGYLALALNEKVSRIDSNARSYLMKAHSSSQHLGKLFQDLLTSAKAEDGRLVSHPTVVELGQFTEQLTEDLRFAAEKKGLLVERLIGSSGESDNSQASGKTVKPLYYVMADSDRLREVITNLFDNAAKYTEKGKISVGLTGNSEVAQLFIQDTGVGIPKDDIPHMFQKFYRVDNSATRTIGGTGLGLFICKKIIELYKGKIWVESVQGKGSTFYITLPRISTQEALEKQKNTDS